MFLIDYYNAIEKVAEILGSWSSICFRKIRNSYDGSKFIFEADPDTIYVYFVKEEKLERHYRDTWRDPMHKDVLYMKGV